MSGKIPEQPDQRVVMLKGTDENLRVLGLGWNPKNSSITYEVTLNFNIKKRRVVLVETLLKMKSSALLNFLTRRVVSRYLVNQGISEGSMVSKAWLGRPLRANVCNKWSNFLPPCSALVLQRLCLQRCLRSAETIGLPWLIILTDGSDLTYGFAAYIR